MRPFFAVCAAVAAAFAAAAEPAPPGSRRDREDPELIVESGGRMAMCDDLRFTRDGKQLLAVGDDKVVRVWQCRDGKLDGDSVRALRWGIWREQHGAIYALAVSDDDARIVIGGLGPRTSTVAVLNLSDGNLVDTVLPKFEPGVKSEVWAAAFAPSGKRVAFGCTDGSVWVWDFKASPNAPGGEPRRLGKHAGARDGANRVRLLRFLAEDRLLSASEYDGDVLEWDPNAKPAKPQVRVSFGKGPGFFRVELDRDGQWLAAAPYGPSVLLRSLDGKESIDLKLNADKREFARSLAFDPKGRRLAVGVGSIVGGKDANFFLEGDDRIAVYDLGASPPKESPGPPHSFRAERLTFHPLDANLLAVAGGDNHEVSLWDIREPSKPVSVMQGKGSCLWGVALSSDGERLGICDRRDPKSDNPNARADKEAPWRVFQLRRRIWPTGDFTPTPQKDTADGWRVEPDPADRNFRWRVIHQDGTAYTLPWDADREGMPRCYTFIEGKDGRPLRLAVGHDWGLSIFEVKKDGVRRVRLCVGHQGEVMALAVSADRTWLVSAGIDQTVAAWSLDKEWPSQPILGASFERVGDHLTVKEVDVGSPAWEAGLVAKDEVVAFQFNAEGWDSKHPDEWLDRLMNHPVPGKELLFEVRREGYPDSFKLLTTVKQRPLWRFFPTRDNEWVLWMWRNPYYDASTNGDYLVGWHVNALDPLGAPTFYRAEQFRDVFQRENVIDKLLLSRDPTAALSVPGLDPLPVRFSDVEPPPVQLKLGPVQPGRDVEATLRVTVRGENPDARPKRVEVWINGYRAHVLTDVQTDKWATDGLVRERVVSLPADKFRAGDNVVTLQVYNGVEARAETSQTLNYPKPPAPPRLFVLAVGIDDYKASSDGAGKPLPTLDCAGNDARAMAEAWAGQKMYPPVTPTVLPDPKKGLTASRDDILKALDALAAQAGPDDRCVVFLAGHGDGRQVPAPGGGPGGRGVPKTAGAGSGGRSEFIFCPPTYNTAKPDDTGLPSSLLYEHLAKFSCHTAVLIDACHSGAAATADNPARALTPGGQGPVVLSACDVNQESIEDPTVRHGLFTAAVLQALDDPKAALHVLSEKDRAPSGGKDVLYPQQLFQYAKRSLPRLLLEIREKERTQVPTLFAPKGESYPLAGKE
jgi:WD40 repeat protein